jgi:hypothetical protein
MNTLERETDPLKLAAMIAESDKDIAVWQMQDKDWNAYLAGKAPIQIENLELKGQVSTLIQTLDTITSIQEQLKPVSRFIHSIQKAPAPSRMSKAEKQQLEDEQLNAAMQAKALKKLLSKEGLN